MKKKKSLLCILLSLVICMVMLPVSAVNADTVITENKTGTEDGYDYELWKDTGNTSMTLTGGGTFSCEWSNINNALFRKGVKFDCTKTYQEIGNITIDFEADYNPNGNSYLCVYGWTRSPLVEYYIVEAWGSWRPPGAVSKGTVNIDGGTYDIYETTRENQPSIDGNTTFQQYWSVRQDKRTSGTINVGSHFAAWESMGMPMGKLYEAALNVEGYQSSGSAVISKNDISVGGKIPDPDSGNEPDTPDDNGYYFHSTYEDGSDSWTSRGDAVIKTVSDVAHAGSKSLFVSNRTDSWNGTARSLNTATFVPGKSYSFSIMAMQDSTASEDFKLTLQYDKDGETNYSTIAENSGSKNQWVQLAETNYTIPSGASNLLLYVETADSTTSFYIDEAIGASGGTKISVEAAKLMGDVNQDGKVDGDDLSDLQGFILRRISDIDAESSDMNDNGVIDSFDLVLLRKAVCDQNANTPENKDDTAVDPSKPMVAISFDDGAVGTAPDSSSMRILNALSESGFHATFFYVGNWINSNNQNEIKTAYDMGMEIANHTNSHPNLTELSSNEILNEYNTCNQKLKSIIGAEPSSLLRLPYLASSSTVESTLSNVPLITCAIDTQDWNGATSDQIINTIKNAMDNGSLDNAIVLCHETYDTTAEAMEYLCPYLKSQGWQIVTVSEMFEANGQSLNGGQVYIKCN